jgi:transcriptional regulator with XRE-family HTH domain
MRHRRGEREAKQKRGFGERLPSLLSDSRYGRGRFSLRSLARELGVDHAHLSRIVKGKTKPTVGLILRTCEILHVSYLEFPEMREAIVNDRISRDAKMRDRLFVEVMNWVEENPPPPPGTAEKARYRPTSSEISATLNGEAQPAR